MRDGSLPSKPGKHEVLHGTAEVHRRALIPGRRVNRARSVWENVALYPGLPAAEVMIVIGQRTALRYVLEPIYESFSRALWER